MRHARVVSASWWRGLEALVAMVILGGVGRAEPQAERCELTLDCVMFGHCTRVGEACVIASEADCLQSEACQENGRCAFDPDSAERCVVRGACKEAPACQGFGVCSDDGEGGCTYSSEGCEASVWCTEEARCRTSSGPSPGCVADACLGTPTCRDDGACELVETGEDRACRVTTTKACMESTGCLRFGRCQKDPEGARCRITEAGCKRSEVCRALGRCAAGPEGRCVPDGPGCAASKACQEHEACHVLGGLCVSAGEGAGGPCQGPEVEITGLVARASNEHKATPPYAFWARHLVDRDLRTSWQPDSKKGGVGERVVLTLPRAARVTRLDVANGFQLRDRLGDLWRMNNRATRLLIRVADLQATAILEANVYGFESVELPPVVTDRLEIEILGVDRGSRWNDLALSELRLYGCAP